MGKTKTVVISGIGEEEKKKPSYDRGEKERKRKEKEKKAQKEDKGVRVPGLKGGERVVAVGAELPPETKEEEKKEKEEKKEGKPKVRSKKYKTAKTKIDKDKLYLISDAIKLVKETSYSSFDGTMELHLVVKKKGISVNTTLPYSTGKEKRVEIANEKTIEKLEKGKIDFDVLLATTDMMPKLVPYAKRLGPKGLMPNPKNGTLIKDKKEASNFSTNTVTIKTEKKAPLIHTSVGKVSQKQKELEENASIIIKAIGKRQILKAYLKATMSPSVKLIIN